MIARRVTSTLAGTALILGIVAGMVPARAVPDEYYVPPGVVDVNCGSVFSSTQWSLDEGYEPEIIGRLVSMMLLFFLAFVLSLVAIPLLVLRIRIWQYGT